MTSRVIGHSVQIKPPLSETAWLMSTLDPSALIMAAMPTDTEVRDAMAKLRPLLIEAVTARTAGQDGWEIGDPHFRVVVLDRAEMALFGTVVITRKDDIASAP